MKVWITKHCLTQGIVERDVQWAHNGVLLGIVKTSPSEPLQYYFKRHWHDTREEAVAAAERMRVRKIESLRKQIAKLENLRF